MRLSPRRHAITKWPGAVRAHVVATFCGGRLSFSHVSALISLFALTLAAAPQTRAEYLVLRSGQRLSVTGYQLVGDTYHLQLNGGTADLPASEVVSIEPEEIFTRKLPPPPATTDTKSCYRNLILSAASRYRVDPDLITSIITAESNFDPHAISRRNARGLMQLLPQTATQLGVKNIFDPTENIDAGTRYLSTLLDRYHNNLALTLAAYNAGPQSVERYRSVPPYRETHSYINKVSRTYAQTKSPATTQPQKTKQASLSTLTRPTL
jgi:soluble lytic murein transglycosylase-like protein